MIFLKSFKLPDGYLETERLFTQSKTSYESFYPFGIFPNKLFSEIFFDEPITIFYGGNGSGKTTLLNIIAEKMNLARVALYNKSPFLEPYLKLCDFECEQEIPRSSMMIASDDVFNFMLNRRALNQKTNFLREELFDLYNEVKYRKRRKDVVNDHSDMELFDRNMAILESKSKLQFAKKSLTGNVREYSNGESALQYFQEKIDENALYLLDEPENSLSPEKQTQLAEYIENSARGCGCQFIIATHSPFLLAMKRSRIYDLDSYPVEVKKWTELENVRLYRDFFKEHESEF
jgi:predicted ATPase